MGSWSRRASGNAELVNLCLVTVDKGRGPDICQAALAAGVTRTIASSCHISPSQALVARQGEAHRELPARDASHQDEPAAMSGGNGRRASAPPARCAAPSPPCSHSQRPRAARVSSPRCNGRRSYSTVRGFNVRSPIRTPPFYTDALPCVECVQAACCGLPYWPDASRSMLARAMMYCRISSVSVSLRSLPKLSMPKSSSKPSRTTFWKASWMAGLIRRRSALR